MGFVKSIKPWQLSVLLAVLVAGAGGSYGIYSIFSDSGEVILEADQQLIPIQLGDLVNEVSVSGSIIYPNRETLTFSSQGILEEMLVTEGQPVLENDVLASLDPETIANLERSVAQARVALRDSEEELVEFKNVPSPLDLAIAHAKVVDAEIALEEALVEFKNVPSPLDLAIAHAKVVDAEIALEEALVEFKNVPSPLDLAIAHAKVVDAEIALADASETLGLVGETSDLLKAQAEAKVATASITLANEQDALDALITPPSEQEFASAKSRVASMELALQNAIDLLERLREPASNFDIAQASAKVSAAKLIEANAHETVQIIKDGSSAEELADAAQKVKTAQTALANAKSELSFVTRDWERKLEDASTDLQSETENYLAELRKWLGVDLDADQLDVDVTVVLDALGADLTVLFAPDLRHTDLEDGGYYSQGLPADDPNTPWDEAIVFTWLNFSAATIVGTCNDAAPYQGFCVKQEFEAVAAKYQIAVDSVDSQTLQSAKAIEAAKTATSKAEDSLKASLDAETALAEPVDSLSLEDAERQLAVATASVQDAEDALTKLLEPPSQLGLADQTAQIELTRANLLEAEEDLADLRVPQTDAVLDDQRSQVDLAKVSLDQAKEDLAILLAAPDSTELEAKRLDVEVATLTLQDLQEDLAILLAATDPTELEARRLDVEVATLTLQDLQEDLAILLALPDPTELEARRLDVEVATLTLQDLSIELADLKLGPDPLNLSLMETNVATAQAALDQAETKLANATIHAPWSGVILTIAVEVGETVGINTPIMEIVDPTIVEVDGAVDEIDVLFVRIGSKSVVSMDALPGESMEGTVSSVDSAARNQQGVVSYPIRIAVTPPDGMDLPEGLSAVASVVIREDRDVLLVPIQSLYGTFEDPSVKIMVNGTIVDRPVVLGNTDDFWAVVSDGVAEGEVVVMESQETQTERFGGGGFRRFGGGFGGGGGGRGGRGGR